MAKSKKKKIENPLKKKLINLQLTGNSLFKERESLIAKLEVIREALQINLDQQHNLEEKIKNG